MISEIKPTQDSTTTPQPFVVTPAVHETVRKLKQDLRMGREHQQGQVNWITTIFMGLFHVGAIAALFFFSWKEFGRRRHYVFPGHQRRHRYGLPPPLNSSRLQDSKVDGVLPYGMRHHGARGWPDLLGSHAPGSPSELRSRR